jgi:hypothetical protein
MGTDQTASGRVGIPFFVYIVPAGRRPADIVYQEGHPSEIDAVARERQIKRWTR